MPKGNLLSATENKFSFASNKLYYILKLRLKKEIIKLIKNGVYFFGCGGALGFDTMAARLIVELKLKYPQIKLIMVLPCYNQDKYWTEKDKKVYAYILAKCDKIVYTSKIYTKECMFKRNRWLIDNSDYCIAYCYKNNGGSAYTVNYGESKGIRIINLAKK